MAETELMCPACTVVYTFETVPVAMECEQCGTLILPRDQAYVNNPMAKARGILAQFV